MRAEQKEALLQEEVESEGSRERKLRASSHLSAAMVSAAAAGGGVSVGKSIDRI